MGFQVLGTLAGYVSSLTHTVATIAEILLNINYFLVKNLIGVFYWLFQGISHILLQISIFSQTAFHDFVSFLGELFTAITQCVQALNKGTENGFMLITTFIKKQVYSFIHILLCIRLGITFFFTKLFDSILVVIEGIFSLISLAFRSVIFVLELIPYTIALILGSIYSGFESVILFIVNIIVDIFNSICNSLVQSFLFCQSLILSLSSEAYLGLFIFIAVSIVIFKAKHYLYSNRHIPYRYFISFLYGVRNTFYWFNLTQRVRRIKNYFARILRYLCRTGQTRSMMNGPIPSGSNATPSAYSNSSQNRPNVKSRNSKKRGSKTKETNEDIDGLAKELEKERDKLLCIICQDSPKTVMLLPCAHVCMCHDCRSTFLDTHRVCPICRRPILDTLRVYV